MTTIIGQVEINVFGDHYSEAVNWGHVGSLNYVKSELADIIRFAGASND